MGRFFPVLAITVAAAIALAATAYPDHEHHVAPEVEHSPWVPVPHADADEHVRYLGEFAVERCDERTHGYLKFIRVVEAEVLDRGGEHYTYHLLVRADGGRGPKLYKCEVFQDLSGHEEPPVLNLGYFEPL
ncbi:unnamed protein product [Victoria cruziana]